MEIHIDFVRQLEFDVALKILESLDDPSDLIRASAVSRFWQQFVISNQISKKLCLQLFPQLSSLVCLKDTSCSTTNSPDLKCSNGVEWKSLKRECNGYALLARTFTTCATNECIAEAVSASSTDNYPEESILNTLYPWDKVRFGPCYWSSKGMANPQVPETLIYKLLANICVITEIDIKPFQAYFQPQNPIYSAKAFRFRIGHPKSPTNIEKDHSTLPLRLPADDQFIWTYTSPEFPMDPENCLQRFKLPKPVICIGGYIQIEFLGRVQKQEMDDLYYICVSHVKVMGETLSPKFDIEILEPSSGKFLLKYFPENQNHPAPTSRYSQLDVSNENSRENLRVLEQLFNMLGGNAQGLFPYEWLQNEDEDEDEDEEEDENDFDFVLM